MAADYSKIARETAKIADSITQANEANIKSRAGTDFTFSLKGRKGMSDCLTAIQAQVGLDVVFKSDKEYWYPTQLRKHFPRNRHESYPSKRAVIAAESKSPFTATMKFPG